eukprot:9975613-Lingulodinium_polyedra.AAC.1
MFRGRARVAAAHEGTRALELALASPPGRGKRFAMNLGWHGFGGRAGPENSGPPRGVVSTKRLS